MVRLEPPSWHYHMDLGFAIHEAALLKYEAIQFSISILRLFNLAEFDAENWL